MGNSSLTATLLYFFVPLPVINLLSCLYIFGNIKEKMVSCKKKDMALRNSIKVNHKTTDRKLLTLQNIKSFLKNNTETHCQIIQNTLADTKTL